MDSEPDTATHIRGAADGDLASLDWLVDRFSPALLAQAYHRMGPALRRVAEPEDVVQEVWAIALGKLSEFEARGERGSPALLKFLGAILMYRVNKLLRSRIAQQGVEQDALTDPRARGVVTSVIRRENVDHALSAIAALSEAEREVLVLRVLEQRPAREVAGRLSISEASVYTRQHRALQVLRERLPGSVFDDLPPASSD